MTDIEQKIEEILQQVELIAHFMTTENLGVCFICKEVKKRNWLNCCVGCTIQRKNQGTDTWLSDLMEEIENE